MELVYSPASLELACRALPSPAFLRHHGKWTSGFKRGQRCPVWVAAGIEEADELVQFPTLVRTGIPEDLRPTSRPSGSVLNSKEDTGTFTAESRRP